MGECPAADIIIGMAQGSLLLIGKGELLDLVFWLGKSVLAGDNAKTMGKRGIIGGDVGTWCA